VGGAERPYLTISEALPFLPIRARKLVHAQCRRYEQRIRLERDARGTMVLDREILFARENELPARRDEGGRTQYQLDKELLIIKLLGWVPSQEHTP